MYLHCASDLLSKIHHMMDMTQILTEGLNHYTMVHGLTSIKLQDKVAGHQSASWKATDDYFSDIHAFSSRYERAKDYSRAYFCTPEVL